MNDILIVTKFTMKDMLKRKSFIIATIIILLMIIIGFNIPRIIDAFTEGEGKDKILISDINNLFENKLTLLNNPNNSYEIIATKDNLDTLKNKINDEEASFGIIIQQINNEIKLTYVVENAYFFRDNYMLGDVINTLYKTIQIDKLDITNEEKVKINTNFDIDVIEAKEETKGNLTVMMMLSMILFYAVYFCTYQVSSSITTEKTSKIIETLVTSTSPRNIVLGKTIGIGLTGLMQLLLFIITAIICAKSFIDATLLEQLLDVSTLTFSLIIITLLYFILGYFAFAFLYALTGSTVSKPEDIQSANTPVIIISLVGFYLAYFTMMNPNSNLGTLASLVPISSPFCMPMRIMMGIATTQDILLSIVILIITIIIVAKITIKVYSNAIINYGSKLTLNNIISFYKEK